MERHITTLGAGSADSVPDVARVDLRIGASDGRVREAVSAMSRHAEAVLAAVGDAGAAETTTARLTIRTEHDREGTETGFRAETAIGATVALAGGSGDAVGAVLGAAVEAGGDALTVDGVVFEATDPEPAVREALEAAVSAARSRAEAIATASGLTITGVASVEQQRLVGDQPMPRAARAEMAGPPIAPGPQTSSVQVRVVFEVG